MTPTPPPRVLLLRHFEEAFDPEACHGTCDNCRRRSGGELESKVWGEGGGQLVGRVTTAGAGAGGELESKVCGGG